MTGPSWLVDKSRIATKIKSASGACDHGKVAWRSNPTRACPNCQYAIDNSDVVHEWPGLPKGVKFDPSDQELIWHLLAKAGVGDLQPHPFIDEFITTLEVDDGICYTHPQHLPGVEQDGRASHFFHRAIKAYNTGTRKRRKIHDQGFGDVRWHKTGRTKPVILNGVQKGCKKIMVLYTSTARGGKAEKTNWVMHQYHLGMEEDEKDGEYVISKVFYQQQEVKLGGDKDARDIAETANATIVKVDPVTPKSVTPEPPRNETHCSDRNIGHETHPIPQSQLDCLEEIQADCEELAKTEPVVETQLNEGMDEQENNADEEQKWWDGESQNLLDSQQLVEALSLCDDLLQSQSPNRDGQNGGRYKDQPGLSVYAQLGPDYLKKDIEACQNLDLDPANLENDAPPEFEQDLGNQENDAPSDSQQDLANIENDTPSEFRLSQLEFGSQDSFLSWGCSQAARQQFN